MVTDANAQPQTGLEERIADVLREHTPKRNVFGVYTCAGKGCTFPSWSHGHVAAAVVAALGLTEETRNAYIAVGRWADPIHPKNYQDQHRWTSPWVPVGGSTPK